MSHNDLVKFITFIVLLLNNTPSLNCLCKPWVKWFLLVGWYKNLHISQEERFPFFSFVLPISFSVHFLLIPPHYHFLGPFLRAQQRDEVWLDTIGIGDKNWGIHRGRGWKIGGCIGTHGTWMGPGCMDGPYKSWSQKRKGLNWWKM